MEISVVLELPNPSLGDLRFALLRASHMFLIAHSPDARF